MYYEINVSRLEDNAMMPGKQYYRHLFATAPRSIQTQDDLKRAYPRIKSAFPEPEYKVEVTEHPEHILTFGEEELATLQITE